MELMLIPVYDYDSKYCHPQIGFFLWTCLAFSFNMTFTLSLLAMYLSNLNHFLESCTKPVHVWKLCRSCWGSFVMGLFYRMYTVRVWEVSTFRSGSYYWNLPNRSVDDAIFDFSFKENQMKACFRLLVWVVVQTDITTSHLEFLFGTSISSSSSVFFNISELHISSLQTEKAYQKQPTIFQNKKRVAGKVTKAKEQRFIKSVGLGFKTPRDVCIITVFIYYLFLYKYLFALFLFDHY